MKRTILFLFLSSSVSGFSQDEVEWFLDGQEWYYNIYCFQSFFCGFQHYEVSGAEMLGEHEATILESTYYTSEGTTEPISETQYLRYSNDTVWRYATQAEQWHMLWDMGAEVGDVWTIQEAVYYGYGFEGEEPTDIPLFKVRVDSIAFWDDIPNSSLSNRRVIYVNPVVNETEESLYTFGPILDGVGPINGAHDLIGNSSATALPLQSPYFQCFLEGGQLAYGAQGSPCLTLGTDGIEQTDIRPIYPNPSSERIFWDDSLDELRIIDLQGRLVYRNNQLSSVRSVPIDQLSGGTYILQMEVGENSFIQKLVVKP
ncbi:MAG: T9SS type A sorting domain-containing protein [Flavobacteriales bacterium]|nr:T9SS type A sorting domain-containing protein [Flavobacteriales bacterium]